MILPGAQHKKKAQDKEMAQGREMTQDKEMAQDRRKEQDRAEKDICIGDTKVQNEQKIDQELKK